MKTENYTTKSINSDIDYSLEDDVLNNSREVTSARISVCVNCKEGVGQKGIFLRHAGFFGAIVGGAMPVSFAVFMENSITRYLTYFFTLKSEDKFFFLMMALESYVIPFAFAGYVIGRSLEFIDLYLESKKGVNKDTTWMRRFLPFLMMVLSSGVSLCWGLKGGKSELNLFMKVMEMPISLSDKAGIVLFFVRMYGVFFAALGFGIGKVFEMVLDLQDWCKTRRENLGYGEL